MSSPATALAEPYSRTFIPNDQETPPYTLTGSRRTIFLVIYISLLVSALAGMAYTLYINPLFAVVAFVIAYYFDNLAFAFGHLEFHTEFIEIPEVRMGTLCHNSFIHHYRNRGVYHEQWLETRMSYFHDPKNALNPKVFLKYLAVALLFGALSYFVSPVLGIAVFSMQSIALLLQSTVHEWYHNPVQNRKSFYSFPAYLLFTLLEKVSIASTRGHIAHHQHGLKDLDHVEKWLDLFAPGGELLPTITWRKALSLYEPGKSRMNDYVIHGPCRLNAGFRVTAAGLITASYLLLDYLDVF